MAEGWQRFSARVDGLASEWNQLISERAVVTGQIDKMTEKVEQLKTQRDEIDKGLADVKQQQKFLMGGFSGSNSTSNMVTGPRSRAQDNLISPSAKQSLPTITDESPSKSHVASSGSRVHGQSTTDVHPPIPSKSTSPIKNATPTKMTAPIKATTPTKIATPLKPSTPAKTANPTIITTDDVSAGTLYNRCKCANDPIHEDFPTVVNMDGKWTDVSCGLCGANASYRNKPGLGSGVYFYGGIMGLNNHVRSAHKADAGAAIVETLKTCTRRVVSDEDVALMEKGKDPKVKIHINTGKQFENGMLQQVSQSVHKSSSRMSEAEVEAGQTPTKRKTGQCDEKDDEELLPPGKRVR